MAICTVKRTPPPPAPPPEIESVTLVLTGKEARALNTVLWNVGGASEIRDACDAVCRALCSAGVGTAVRVGVSTSSVFSTPGAIYFKEGAKFDG